MAVVLEIMQGDQYGIPFELTDADGEPITESAVEDVEIALGDTVKTYADGEVTYEDGRFLYPLTAEESMAYPAFVSGKVRVTFSGGEIVGAPFGIIEVTPWVEG